MPMYWLAMSRRHRVAYRLLAMVYAFFGIYTMGWAHYVASPEVAPGPYMFGAFLTFVGLANVFWALPRLRKMYMQTPTLKPFWS